MRRPGELSLAGTVDRLGDRFAVRHGGYGSGMTDKLIQPGDIAYRLELAAA